MKTAVLIGFLLLSIPLGIFLISADVTPNREGDRFTGERSMGTEQGLAEYSAGPTSAVALGRETHVSTARGIAFDYPATWTVTEGRSPETPIEIHSWTLGTADGWRTIPTEELKVEVYSALDVSSSEFWKNLEVYSSSTDDREGVVSRDALCINNLPAVKQIISTSNQPLVMYDIITKDGVYRILGSSADSSRIEEFNSLARSFRLVKKIGK